jgi:hypothetical protein
VKVDEDDKNELEAMYRSVCPKKHKLIGEIFEESYK